MKTRLDKPGRPSNVHLEDDVRKTDVRTAHRPADHQPKLYTTLLLRGVGSVGVAIVVAIVVLVLQRQ